VEIFSYSRVAEVPYGKRGWARRFICTTRAKGGFNVSYCDFVENEGWCVYDLWVELIRVIYSLVYADAASVAIECGFDHISGVSERLFVVFLLF
jgi:hypothetical protein